MSIHFTDIIKEAHEKAVEIHQPTPLEVAEMDFERAYNCLHNCTQLFLRESLRSMEKAQHPSDEARLAYDAAKALHELEKRRLERAHKEIFSHDSSTSYY